MTVRGGLAPRQPAAALMKLSLLLLLALSASNAMGRAAEQEMALPPGAWDDHTFFHRLEAAATKFFDAGKTSTNLSAQLTRRSCALRLRSPNRRRLTPADMVERSRAAVAIVGKFYHCDRCAKRHFETASGFVISESGALVTCLHVLTKGKTLGLVVMTADGRLRGIREVLASDSANDLLVLQLEGNGFAALPVSTNAPSGAPVVVLSHPGRHYYAVTTGHVSRYHARQQAGQEGISMSITADFARGSSGAPVFNETGAVVGIVNSTQGIYYDTHDGEKEDLQMVIKDCTPTTALLRLIRPP